MLDVTTEIIPQEVKHKRDGKSEGNHGQIRQLFWKV